jgi:hypothetical protein
MVKPKAKLEEIIGNVTYFAYPFGLWNKEAIPEVKERMQMAFILSLKRFNRSTIRRMIVSGTWTGRNDRRRSAHSKYYLL